jgi:muramoyltetrapeptide carboxypeptidase
VKPTALKPGDHVRVVSPASPVSPEQVAQGVALLESEGYAATFGEHAYDRDGYLAGSDVDRAADLMAAFLDPTVACVMCSRGGYGCARLLLFLDLDAMAASGKMLCGFSDITTLHLALNRRGLVTMHTPMLLSFSVDREPWVVESFKSLLRGDATVPAGASKGETLVGGSAEGVVTGGCMCLLGDSLSTPDPLETEGKILLLEDVDESPHRVDALLTHFLNAGLLQSAAGIVVGEMTNTDEKVDPKIGAWSWRRIIEDRLSGLGIPTIVNYPIGHMKTMMSVPLGVRARLDADAGTLTYTESPCS